MSQTLRRFDEGRAWGVEIEAFGVPAFRVAEALQAEGIPCHVEHYNHRRAEHWKIVPDASISGPNPFELVSPPLRGQAGLDQLRRVGAILQRIGAKVNSTCGFHVHHDARDFELRHFKSLLYLYARMEHTLDEAMPPSRRENHNPYCRSVRWTGNHPGIERVRTLEALCQIVGNRYHKLNLHAWLRHGTVEFRHHSGTTDPQKMLAWVIFTQLLVQKARSGRVTYKERRAAYCRRNPRDLLVVDLGLHQFWREVDEQVRWAIHFLANRIRHFRQAAQAALEEAA